MALTITQKTKIRASLHRAYSNKNLPISWNKPDVDSAITDADSWMINNAASFAAALSQPFRSSSSAADKSVLLIATAIAQRLVDNPEHVDILRHILAELDGMQGA